MDSEVEVEQRDGQEKLQELRQAQIRLKKEKKVTRRVARAERKKQAVGAST